MIAEYPLATAADVRLAIDAAVAAWPAWKKTPGPERGRVLWRAADIARRRIDEIARTLTREEGKILKEARGEVLKGISLLEYYAGEGFRMHGKTLPSESRDTFTYTDAPAARRRRADRAVEFPVGDSGLEKRAGDRRRQLRRLQAGRAHAGHLGRCWPRSTRRRDCRRRVQHAGRIGLARSARRW